MAGSLTISAAGQSLTVDIQTPGAQEQPVYTDATLGTPITLPLAITADQDFYLPAGTNEVTVTVTTAAGLEILNETVVVGDTTHAVLYPRPTEGQQSAFESTGVVQVGNSAAGTTLGTVVKKVEVFDTAGASLGFVAVYDAIT